MSDNLTTLPAETMDDVLEPARQAVEIEGAAPTAPTAGEMSVWLFRAGVEPEQVPWTTVPRVVTDTGTFVWVDLSGYSERQLREVATTLGLHRVAVHAALSQWQRPRVDLFSDHFFVSATVARLDTQAYRVLASQLDLFVGRNFLVSAHKLPLPFVDSVLARARNNPSLLQLDPALMLYIVLDELLGYYEGLDEHVRGEIELLEQRALADPSDGFLQNLLRFKRYAFALSHLADQHRTVFSAFVRPDFQFASGNEVDVYFRDLETRQARLLDALSDAKDAVTGAFDIYISHMSHRTNQIIKVLTMLSAILLPMTVILGIFGTNFERVPLYQPIDFALMLLIMVLVGGGIVFVFRHKGWI